MTGFPEKLKLGEVVPHLSLSSNRNGNVQLQDIENNAPVPSIFITCRFGVLRYQETAYEAHELPMEKKS